MRLATPTSVPVYRVTACSTTSRPATSTSTAVRRRAPHAGLHNCYLPSGTNGVGTTDLTNATYAPMYKSASGWDFTTGLGTPNVNNLVNAMRTSH